MALAATQRAWTSAATGAPQPRLMPRLALLAAFPFPLPQGSQVYVAEQARALARASADVTLLCYGHGLRDDVMMRDLSDAGVHIRTGPAPLSRTPLRAGPHPRKLGADAALLGTLLAEQRRSRFDAILAHNAEAACIALAARALGTPRVVYVAHTLLESELRSYASVRAVRTARALDRFGHGLDRFLAARADAVIALTAAAAAALAPFAPGRVAHVRPALDPAPPPHPDSVDAACRRHGLVRGAFAVYAGNLDAYQDLALLADASTRLGKDEVVIVTHDPRRRPPPGPRVVRAGSAREARDLLFGAALAVVPRRSLGGFPIKLLNYAEAQLAIVAFEGIADGFTHERDAWLLPLSAGAAELASAIRTLRRDGALAARLGAAARRLLDARFSWKAAIPATLSVSRV